MGGKHSNDSRMVTVWMHEELIALLEGARWRARRNRSQFIREAIAEKMAKLGIVVTPELIYGEDYVDNPIELRVAEPAPGEEQPDDLGERKPTQYRPPKSRKRKQ